MSFRKTNGHKRRDYEPGDQLTEQTHEQASDINHIIDRYTRTGILDHNSQYAGQYGDFVDAPDYIEAQTLLADANSMFESLPGEIRQQFPQGTPQFLQFVNDPDNAEHMKALGLYSDAEDWQNEQEELDVEIPKKPVYGKPEPLKGVKKEEDSPEPPQDPTKE